MQDLKDCVKLARIRDHFICEFMLFELSLQKRYCVWDVGIPMLSLHYVVDHKEGSDVFDYACFMFVFVLLSFSGINRCPGP